MKQQGMRRNNNNRNRSRRGNTNNHNLRAQTYDSNGPDVRIRGTASQIFEKYCVLAKDAASSGDKIMAENYLQHAEHYQRIINFQNEQLAEQRQRRWQERQNELEIDEEEVDTVDELEGDDAGIEDVEFIRKAPAKEAAEEKEAEPA